MSQDRRRLDEMRPGVTHRFSFGGIVGYITGNTYADGTLGEIFVKIGKQGDLIGALMDAVAIAVSIGLQHGIPLETYANKFVGQQFNPAGLTDNRSHPMLRMARSILDYVFRWLSLRFPLPPVDIGESNGPNSDLDDL